MSTGEGKAWYEVLNLDKNGEVPLNIVLFRAKATAQEEGGPARLAQAINATRQIYVSPAKAAVRLAVSNWMTGLHGDEDFERLFARFWRTLQ